MRPLFRFAALVCLCLLPGLCFGQARSYDLKGEDLDVHVNLHFLESYRPGWVPVAFFLTNKSGSERTIDLELTTESYRSEVNFGARRSVDLPPKGRKRVTLYVHRSADYLPRFNVKIREGDETPTGLKDNYTGDLSGLSDSYYQPPVNLLVLSKEEGNFLGYVQNRRLNQYNTVRIRHHSSTRLLPDRWPGYDSVDLVMVHGFPLETLSDAQLQALHQYVKLGGHILFAPTGNESWFQTREVQQFLGKVEVETESVQGLRTLDRYARTERNRDPFLHHKLTIPGGDALLGQSWGERILMRRPLGKGSALALGIDPQVLSTYGNRIRFWDRLLQTANVAHRNGQYEYHGARPYLQVGAELDGGRLFQLFIEEELLPSVLFVVLLVLIYVVLVGPVNFYVLKRWNMPVYIIWTIPLVVLVTTTFIFASGYLLKGVNTRTKSVSIVHGRLEESSFVEETFLSILPSASATFDLAPGPNGAILPVGRESNRNNRGGPATWSRQDEGMILDDYPLTLWQTGLFQVLAPRSEPGGIGLVRNEDGDLTLVNGTSFELGPTVIKGGADTLYQTDGCPPGATRRLEMDPGGVPGPGADRIQSLFGWPAHSFEGRVIRRIGFRGSRSWKIFSVLKESPTEATVDGSFDPDRSIGILLLR